MERATSTPYASIARAPGAPRDSRRSVTFQVAAFLLVGTLNTLVDIGILNLIIIALDPQTIGGIAFAKAASFAVAVTNSYVWNRQWTFSSARTGAMPIATEYARFIAASLAGLVVNTSAFTGAAFAIQSMSLDLSIGVRANLAALAASAAALSWNFLSYKHFVFRHRKI